VSRTYIIAEAGVNHNGVAENAFALVEAAVAAGADAVKFQTFKAENLVTQSAATAEYQQTATGESSQYAMLKRLELSHEIHFRLIEQCKKNNIDFLSTAFDHESLSFLLNELKLTKLKIPSGEITNAPLVLAHAYSQADLIVSTGMATLQEVQDVLSVIAFGLIAGPKELPSREKFALAFASATGKSALKSKVTLLHCTTEYPAPFNEINLRAMDTLAEIFQLPVGYSDHSEGIAVPTAAVARGAILIEKHFTLDRNMPGPDHQASLEPQALKAMVNAIRSVEASLGNGDKEPQPSEKKNMLVARKSLIAAKDIHASDVFSPDNVAVKRPGGGISPMSYWQLIGTSATKDIKAGEYIDV